MSAYGIAHSISRPIAWTFFGSWSSTFTSFSKGDRIQQLLAVQRRRAQVGLRASAGDPRGYSYFSFDDPAALAAAKADPNGFVAELSARTILDEVQRVPELFSPLKLAVDRRRTPGRFLLTGSADVLLLPRVAESLAGRVEILVG